MTCMFDQAVLLFEEIGCGSLLGLKGFRESLFDSLIVVALSFSMKRSVHRSRLLLHAVFSSLHHGVQF